MMNTFTKRKKKIFRIKTAHANQHVSKQDRKIVVSVQKLDWANDLGLLAICMNALGSSLRMYCIGCIGNIVGSVFIYEGELTGNIRRTILPG